MKRFKWNYSPVVAGRRLLRAVLLWVKRNKPSSVLFNPNGQGYGGIIPLETREAITVIVEDIIDKPY